MALTSTERLCLQVAAEFCKPYTTAELGFRGFRRRISAYHLFWGVRDYFIRKAFVMAGEIEEIKKLRSLCYEAAKMIRSTISQSDRDNYFDREDLIRRLFVAAHKDYE